jgi:hypothetical protein
MATIFAVIMKFGDIIQMDFEENVDDFKTYNWFKFADKLHHQRSYDAIFKMDTDTLVDWCGVCSIIKKKITKGRSESFLHWKNEYF